MNENTYPVSYDQFKNRIIEIFIEKDWNYNTKFSKEQKKEFIENSNINFWESYQEECANYDNGYLNVFTTPEDTHKYIMGLLFECEMYFISKTSQAESKKPDEIDESKYPMIYKEFEKILGELFVEDAPKMYKNVSTEEAKEGWKNFLKEQGPFNEVYEEYCEMYDNPSKRDVAKEEVFTKTIIGRQTYSMVQWVYF